ncbi:hypothetical protein T484DRAFT_1624643 [Baffinella frigidus]|nr:hypothetical protein T484DRAFT_1624643 [Cryptophyta sp. CCMP2293]
MDLYSPSVAALSPDTCLSCPANTRSDIGSSNITNCSCTLGFIGSDGSQCTPCPAGTYKTNNGTGVCSECGMGTWSTTLGAPSQDTCELCEQGTYSPLFGLNNASLCAVCPVFPNPKP